jgi:hypothetical protein
MSAVIAAYQSFFELMETDYFCKLGESDTKVNNQREIKYEEI